MTNRLEQLFLDERRRLKMTPNAFGERPLLKFLVGAMIRASERWCVLSPAGPTRCQIVVRRGELDQSHEAENGIRGEPSADAGQN